MLLNVLTATKVKQEGVMTLLISQQTLKNYKLGVFTISKTIFFQVFNYNWVRLTFYPYYF